MKLKVANLAYFLRKRNQAKIKLNQEFNSLKRKFEYALKKRGETILFSIPLTETIVFLNPNVIKTHFPDDLYYPEEGLFLREIEIMHCEFITKELEYGNTIMAKFKFNIDGFNFSIPLKKMNPNAIGTIIEDRENSVGYDPEFPNGEKFKEIWNALNDVIKQIDAITI